MGGAGEFSDGGGPWEQYVAEPVDAACGKREYGEDNRRQGNRGGGLWIGRPDAGGGVVQYTEGPGSGGWALSRFAERLGKERQWLSASRMTLVLSR